MQSKYNFLSCVFFMFFVSVSGFCYADIDEEVLQEDIIVDQDFSADSVADYDVEGSVFQQITMLEQEKVLMQLEKEKAQLDLELDKLAAEKIKLQMEIDTLSGRAEQEQQELENEKARLEAEAQKIEREREQLKNTTEQEFSYQQPKEVIKKESVESNEISQRYKLVNIMGAGDQLQATLSDLSTGQTKRVTVGKQIDGFKVKSISLDDGVAFIKDGEIQNLNISGR